MNLISLQKTIIDSLEDIKAQDIQVFDTQKLTDLHDQVIIASASSSRQARSLGQHLYRQLTRLGYGDVRIEGEENGEWVLVDCIEIVVHIMQENIRQYYRLEELWGGKPLKLAA